MVLYFLETNDGDFGLVLTIFYKGDYLTFKLIFHKALNLFEYDCEITLKPIPETNQC